MEPRRFAVRFREAQDLTLADRFEPERIVTALNDAGVLYVIVGGLALGAHGVVRATRDREDPPRPRRRPRRIDRESCARALRGF